MKKMNWFSIFSPAVVLFLAAFLTDAGFAQKTLPLDNSTCSESTLNCLWNDHLGCFIRASTTANGGTCIPPDSTGRAGVVEISPDGTQRITTKCSPSVTVNALCDTITSNPFETTTTTTGGTGGGGGSCLGSSGGSGFTDGATGGSSAPDCSPIIIDSAGEVFHLTSAHNGVMFDIRGDGHPIKIAWTDATYRNAFLALDRNHNGKIDDGTELFGNFTPQPNSPAPNGFLALADFDHPENGGNDDGIIDDRDPVFSHLVLWIDENHDGISQQSELHPLPELGVFAISLSYKESRRTDEFGNIFRFRAKINPANHDDQSDAGRSAYDIFLAAN